MCGLNAHLHLTCLIGFDLVDAVHYPRHSLFDIQVCRVYHPQDTPGSHLSVNFKSLHTLTTPPWIQIRVCGFVARHIRHSSTETKASYC